jgi:hypothetical protein
MVIKGIKVIRFIVGLCKNFIGIINLFKGDRDTSLSLFTLLIDSLFIFINCFPLFSSAF